MTVLRVERQSTGELGSVPFVWGPTARSGPGITIDSLAKVAPTYLSLLRGTRSSSPLNNGHWQESFSVFAKRGAENARLEASRLTQMFELAAEFEKNNDQSDLIYLVDQKEDERFSRRAIIYSGVIVQVDDSVVSQDMESGYALFSITLERSGFFEYGAGIIFRETGYEINNHGGRWILPKVYASTGTTSRISNFMIRARSAGNFKKVWVGVKPNRTGFDSTFNPKIRASFIKSLSSDVKIVSDSTAIDGSRIEISFAAEDDWRTRFRVPFSSWNYSIKNGDDSFKKHYVGKYHLLGRYKVYGDSNAIIGYRLGTGWEYDENVSWNAMKFLRPAGDDKVGFHWQYENFGTITIGGGSWTQEISARAILDGFNIYASAQRSRGTTSAKLYLDNMYIVPADHFLFFEFESEIGPDRRAEILTSQGGGVHGYVLESGVNDYPGKPIAGQRKIISGINSITYENWSLPWEENSILVLVGDRDQFHTKEIGSGYRIDLEVVNRTAAYTYGT